MSRCKMERSCPKTPWCLWESDWLIYTPSLFSTRDMLWLVCKIYQIIYDLDNGWTHVVRWYLLKNTDDNNRCAFLSLAYCVTSKKKIHDLSCNIFFQLRTNERDVRKFLDFFKCKYRPRKTQGRKEFKRFTRIYLFNGETLFIDVNLKYDKSSKDAYISFTILAEKSPPYFLLFCGHLICLLFWMNAG